MAEFASPVSPVLFLFCFFYLEGVEKHLIVHLDQPGDSRHLCVRHCIENDVVDTEERHQHQCGLQQFSVIAKKNKIIIIIHFYIYHKMFMHKNKIDKLTVNQNKNSTYCAFST